MSSQKVVVLILFLVIGLPPGLCSIAFAPGAIRMLQQTGESYQYGVLVGALCAVGFAFFAILLAVLIRTWKSEPP
jgi:hypothetical protein